MPEPSDPPFIPPFPAPLTSKAGLLRRFWIGWNSWVHTLFERSYAMKMGVVRLPLLNFFVVNALPLAGRILDDRTHRYPKHHLLAEMLDPLLGQAVFSANGPDWEAQRAMMNPAFAHTHLERAFPAMAAAADDVVAMLRAKDRAAPVDVDPLMAHVTADIIFRTLFSLKLSVAESARVYAAFNAYQGQTQPYAMLRLYRLPLLGYRWRMKRAARGVRAVFEPILRQRLDQLAAGKSPPAPDILGALIAAEHPETGRRFSGDELLDQLGVIFLAGHETSASALSWTLYLLAEQPAWQDRLHAEIIAATGGGAVEFAHLKALPALRNLFREALRLYPPVSFLMREATCPEVMRGKAVAPGDLLVVSPWLIQRNADNWPCPHAFDPDRFDDPAQAVAARHAWLPFGRGPRTCIGAGFATQEAVIILARVIQAFRLRYPDAPKPELFSRLTLRPKNGIRLWVEER